MRSLLVMISLLTFFFTGGDAWAQKKPAPLPPGPRGAPVGQIKPTLPIQPTPPIQPAPHTPITRKPTPTPTPQPKVQPPVSPVMPVAPTKVLIPEVRGYPRERAERFLQGARLTLGKIDTRHSDQPKGTVIGQNPEPGSRVEPRSTVNLTVAIPVPLVIPWGWVMAGLAVASLGGYFLYRAISLPPAPSVEIRVHQRVGEQTVSCQSLRRIDLEVGLRVVKDRGEQEVEIEGSLIMGERAIA